MKIGKFEEASDPFEHDARGITARIVLGMHSAGWGLRVSTRGAALHLGRACIQVKLQDQQVVEARIAKHVKSLEKTRS